MTTSTSSIIHSLLHSRIQLWIWHTQTGSYALHQALSDAYEAIESFTDTLTENSMADADISLAGELKPFVDAPNSISAQVTAGTKLLVSLEQELVNAVTEPTDTVNLRDELCAKLRHARYMMTLN